MSTNLEDEYAKLQAPSSPPAYNPNREQRRAVEKGFRRERRQYRLRFEGTALDGLVVTCRSVAVGTMLELAELAALVDGFTAENISTLGMMFDMLANAIVEWNLEDEDGTPVPATLEGIRTLDMDEAMLLVHHWMEAAVGVPAPLDRGSTATAPSGVASIPMDVESPNPQS